MQVTEYINAWRAANGIPASNNALLTESLQLKLLADVSEQFRSLSVRPDINAGFLPDSRLITYSGNLTTGGLPSSDPPAFELVKVVTAQAGGKLYFISDLEAGNYLNEKSFLNALKAAIGGPDTQAGEVAKLLMGRAEDANKNRITRLGPDALLPFDDFISIRAVGAAKGDLVFWGPNALANKVFGASELAEVMNA